jgi:hypothetical protein
LAAAYQTGRKFTLQADFLRGPARVSRFRILRTNLPKISQWENICCNEYLAYGILPNVGFHRQFRGSPHRSYRRKIPMGKIPMGKIPMGKIPMGKIPIASLPEQNG